MDAARVKSSENNLDRMLLTLAEHGFVTLDPPPPPPADPPVAEDRRDKPGGSSAPPPSYEVVKATPTEALDKLLVFRSIHPLYGAFLLEHLGIADRNERIQALESVLEMPRPLLRYVRVPFPDKLPPGPLAMTRLDTELIRRGLMIAPALPDEEEDEEDEEAFKERPPTLADKLRLLFDATHPHVFDVATQPVWGAGELLNFFQGNFNLYVRGRDIIKQEGIIFRHLLRLILLCGEFAQVCPAETTPDEWQGFLRDLADRLTASCRAVDPTSTDEMIEMMAHAADVVEGEEGADKPRLLPEPPKPEEPAKVFGEGLFDG